MRLAVISDIHADLPALERVLSALEDSSPDEIWCLGDVVGLGGHDPAQVVDLVRERCALVLGGNHDAWVTGALTFDLLPLPRQRTELLWQRAQLSAGQLAWLGARPSHARRADVELWHGSEDDPLTGWINGRQEAAAHLASSTRRSGWSATPIGLLPRVDTTGTFVGWSRCRTA